MTMQQMEIIPTEGIRRSPATAASIIAATTPVVIYTLSGIPAGNLMTAKLVGLQVMNRDAAHGGTIQIGIGTIAAFVQVLPDFPIFASLDTIITEDMLPEYWFGMYTALTTGNILAQTTLAGAASPNNVMVMPTFVEKGI